MISYKHEETNRLFRAKEYRQYAQIARDTPRSAAVLRRIFHRYRKQNDSAHQIGVRLRSKDLFLLSFHRNARIPKLRLVEFHSQTTRRSHYVADRGVFGISQLLQIR